MTIQHKALARLPLKELRQQIRSGSYCSHTAGLGTGYLQANLAIMPQAYALDFMRFCQRNPKPCPLVGVTDTGDPYFRTLGQDIDVRTDVPEYNIYRNGRLAESVSDLREVWQDDFVAFALGCSFTFERALQQAGITVWHIANNSTVPMFKTTIATVKAGVFEGPTVVSMRAIPTDQVDRVVDISRQYPQAHGAPVHIGDPAAIGIKDLSRPDWGDAAPVAPGEVPVFWACGVTPQAAMAQAMLPICVTHKPGRMLITDVPEDAETPVLPA